MSGLPMSSSRREQRKKQTQEAVLQAAANGRHPDDDAKRKAIMDVVQLWLDRLQLISVITSFFASIDTTLLSFTTSEARFGPPGTTKWSNTVKLMNSAIVGALIFHSCAAISSFVGSFVLIRYKLLDAKEHAPHVRSPTAADIKEMFTAANVESPVNAPNIEHTESQTSDFPSIITGPFSAMHMMSMFSMWQNWTDMLSDIHGRVFISQVQLLGCFRPPRNGMHVEPPVRLLSNCHTLSVSMAVIGFILALIGILSFVWTSLPDSVAGFATACLSSCLLAILVTFNMG